MSMYIQRDNDVDNDRKLEENGPSKNLRSGLTEKLHYILNSDKESYRPTVVLCRFRFECRLNKAKL